MKKRELIPLTSYDQEPEGMTEDEAHEFWSTHEITDEYLASMPPVREEDFPPVGQLREYGPIQLDREVFRKARWLARQRGITIEDLVGELVDQAIASRPGRRRHATEQRASEGELGDLGEKESLRARGS